MQTCKSDEWQTVHHCSRSKGFIRLCKRDWTTGEDDQTKDEYVAVKDPYNVLWFIVWFSFEYPNTKTRELLLKPITKDTFKQCNKPMKTQTSLKMHVRDSQLAWKNIFHPYGIPSPLTPLKLHPPVLYPYCTPFFVNPPHLIHRGHHQAPSFA